jgi:hypothetical protein
VGRSPICHLWTADANSHVPSQSPAVALRGHFQNGIFVAWQGNGMVCVSQTRPHCVNHQMGKTRSKPLVERHGRGAAWYVWFGPKRMYTLSPLKKCCVVKIFTKRAHTHTQFFNVDIALYFS